MEIASASFMGQKPSRVKGPNILSLLTIRSGVLISISSRQRSAFSCRAMCHVGVVLMALIVMQWGLEL